LSVVFAVGLLARAILIPITHGQDFVVWDKASAATLQGVNIYAHHPAYPGGPYAYFPLFLYIELPFQWLAEHSAIPFTVLGKLPILVADVAVAALLVAALSRQGHGKNRVAAGAALFFLNPLVIYNSAFYGRFDSLGCALLLLALNRITVERAVSWRGAFYYALAVAAKTFPAFVVLGILRCGRRVQVRVVVAVAIVLAAVSLPYLGSLPAYLRDIVLYDAKKVPQALSWQRVFLHLTDAHGARLLSYLCLAIFVVGALWLTRIGDLSTYTLLTLLLFILCSKVVLEQYLTWPIPWLILALWAATATSRPDAETLDAVEPSTVARRGVSRASLALLTVFTVIGMLVNPYVHPFGRSPEAAGYLLALSITAYLALSLRRSRAAAVTSR
jgi:hypothetical protein